MRLKESLDHLIGTYPAGLKIAFDSWDLEEKGVLIINGWENFPRWTPRILVVSNHQTMMDQFFLIPLFAYQYFFRPFKYGPWTMADRKNFYDNPRFRRVRSRIIPVRRDRVDVASLKMAVDALERGESVIVFPEGGRTRSAPEGTNLLRSEVFGKEMRPLKSGFVCLAQIPGVVVLPIWTDNTSKSQFEMTAGSRVRLTIGQVMKFTKEDRVKDVIFSVGERLLNLADQAG